MRLLRCGYSHFVVTSWRGISIRNSSTTSNDKLQGSVSPHARHLVLFTGRPYNTLPSHIESVSPLYKAILKQGTELQDYALAITDSTHISTQGTQTSWRRDTSRFEKPSEDQDAEAYGAVIYPDRIEVPFAITMATVANGKLREFCKSLSVAPIRDNFQESMFIPEVSPVKSHDVDIFICTHGARDCRCGDVGASYYEALVKEAKRRRVGHAAQLFKEGSGPIRIHRTTHIGGHKFAATCFTSFGDWYGLLSISDAPTFLDYLNRQRNGVNDLTEIWWEKWRGRAGLSRDVQAALADSAIERHRASSTAGVLPSKKAKRKERTQALGPSLNINFKTFDGTAVPVRGFPGETLMDCAKRCNLVEATCEGACECATCHVHLRPNDGQQPPPVPPKTEEESDQLDYALFTDDDSRLACQIEITPTFGEWLERGGVVQLPRY